MTLLEEGVGEDSGVGEVVAVRPPGPAGGSLAWLLPKVATGEVKLSKLTQKRVNREIEFRNRKRRKRGNRKIRTLALSRARYRKDPEKKLVSNREYKRTPAGTYSRIKSRAREYGYECSLSPADWKDMWITIGRATNRPKPWLYVDYTYELVDRTKKVYSKDNLRVLVRSLKKYIYFS